MIRAVLAYLAFAIAGILMVTGLPSGIPFVNGPSDLTKTGPDMAPAGAEPGAAMGQVSIETLLTKAIEAGQSAEQIDKLINASARQGAVMIPDEMRTTAGRVDTAALTASVLAQTPVLPLEQGDTSADDSFVTPQTAILDIQDMRYVVQEGDSLAGLALKFYGNARLSDPILAANADQLPTASALRAGQTLTIPSRSEL